VPAPVPAPVIHAAANTAATGQSGKADCLARRGKSTRHHPLPPPPPSPPSDTKRGSTFFHGQRPCVDVRWVCCVRAVSMCALGRWVTELGGVVVGRGAEGVRCSGDTRKSTSARWEER